MTKKNILVKLSILTIFFSILFFSGCFSHWQGDSAKIIISFTGSNRSAYNPTDSETHQKLEHNIILTNDTKKLQFTFKGNKTFEAYVTPGRWKVTVNSWLDEDIYATSGVIDVDLKAGQDNRLPIGMHQAHLIKFDSNGGSAVPDQIVIHGYPAEEPPPPVRNGNNFGEWYIFENSEETSFDFSEKIENDITLYAKWIDIEVLPGSTLAEKLVYLSNNAVDGGNYIVRVKESESIKSDNKLIYSTNKVNITLTDGYINLNNINKKVTITLTGGGIVNLNNNGSMFIIGSGVTLILENITLKGRDYNNSSLVKVESGGTLIMYEGAIITGNKMTSTTKNGGGVSVDSGGKLEMNEGANITGNKSNYGGGVDNNGTFEMNGGDIYDNTAQGDGGGVAVYNRGTFEMKGGSIQDNKTIDWSGGGVVVAGNSKFIMTGGDINDNTAKGSGGGVYILEGIFTMTGGEINNNETINWGGGGVLVASGGEFTMNGGEISGNSVAVADINQSGGGVLVNNGTFIMNGGEISRNKTGKGGGVAVAAWEHNKIQEFTMTGGSIYNNTANNTGGGVYVAVESRYRENGEFIERYQSKSTFTMNGGRIYGNTVKGNETHFHGGGVFVWNATFTKAAGCTIYGYNILLNERDENNKVVDSNDNVKTGDQGHAVYVNISPASFYENDISESLYFIQSDTNINWSQ
jgi:hypothetical protein